MFLSERNMKKQLFRVKQLADQTFARAEKSEVLTDDLVNAEKRVELIKQVCTNAVKKIQAGLQGQGTDGPAIDKRLKKLPDFQLASTMLDGSSLLGDGSLLGSTFSICGKAESELASCLLTHEVEVEKLVITKFQEVLDNDIPSINKLKKQLSKLTLDMDSAKARHVNATRHSIPTPGNAKVDGIKEELDDATAKVVQCKDALAEEMFSLLAKEHDLSVCVLHLIQSQADYHRKVLGTLEGVIPNMEKVIENHSTKPVYGCPIEEHLRITERKIALPIETCICFLLECGLEEEGLFRIAGSSSKVKKLKNAFDAGFVDMTDYARDPHAVAGALKQYLRELPVPLMTFTLYEEWLDTARHTEQDSRVKAMWNVIRELPEPSYNNLRYLIKFLSKLTMQQDLNKMSTQNLAIVMGPNLMWSPHDDPSALGMNMSLANMYSSIVDLLIMYADYFFEGDEEFFISSPKGYLNDFAGNVFSPTYGSNSDNVSNGDDEHVTSNLSVCVQQTPTVEAADNQTSSSGSCKSSPRSSGSPKLPRRMKKPAPPVPPSLRVASDNAASSSNSVTMTDIAIERPKSSILCDIKPIVSDRPRGHERKSSWLASEIVSRSSSSASASGEIETRTASPTESCVAQTPLSPVAAAAASSASNGPVPVARPHPVPRNTPSLPSTLENNEVTKSESCPIQVPIANDTPFADESSGSDDGILKPLPSPVRRMSLEKPEKPERPSKLSEKKEPSLNTVPTIPVMEKISQKPIFVTGLLVPDRPPRPSNLPLHKDNNFCDKVDEKSAKSVTNTEKLDRTQSLRHCDKPNDDKQCVVVKKPLKHSTNSLDRGGAKAKPVYVNIPDNVGDYLGDDLKSVAALRTITLKERMDSNEREPLKVSDRDKGDTGSGNDKESRDTSLPPNRPEKFDKTRMIPPLRPEKSDRLKALLGSQQEVKSGSPPIRPPAPNTEQTKSSKKPVIQQASKTKDKPARPSYSPSTTKDQDKKLLPLEKKISISSPPSSSDKDRLCPTLNVDVTEGDEEEGSSGEVNNDSNATPRLQTLSTSSSSIPGSPSAPRKPPRPQPRPPLPPVAKPRSTINTEQTHL